MPLNTLFPTVTESPRMTTDLRPVSPLNACAPIEVTFSGITMDVSDVQPRNEFSPIEVSVFGNATFFKLVQFLKTVFPIVCTPSGMVIFSTPEPWKAVSPIVDRFLGQETDLRLEQFS